MRAPRHHHSFSEDLALDALSNVKVEFFEGEIYAMAGGTPEHGELAVAISTELRNQLEKKKPCRTYSPDGTGDVPRRQRRMRRRAARRGGLPHVSGS